MIGASGTIRYLISRIEVEVADIEPSIEAEDIEDVVRGFFNHGSGLELKVSLPEGPYRGNRKVYVLLEEAQALKLLKATHIKSRSCWRCGEEKHAEGYHIGKPQCYLCSAREDKPRDDHIPGTMHCAPFRKAAMKRKSSSDRV